MIKGNKTSWKRLAKHFEIPSKNYRMIFGQIVAGSIFWVTLNSAPTLTLCSSSLRPFLSNFSAGEREWTKPNVKNVECSSEQLAVCWGTERYTERGKTRLLLKQNRFREVKCWEENCLKLFVDEKSMKRHLKTAHNAIKYVFNTECREECFRFSCEICGKNYSSKSALIAHQKSHSDDYR